MCLCVSIQNHGKLFASIRIRRPNCRARIALSTAQAEKLQSADCFNRLRRNYCRALEGLSKTRLHKNQENARKRQEEFFPNAQIYTDHNEVLKREEIEVFDIATHPPERVPLIRDALNAGTHVLSQKPFVLDLDIGEELVALALKNGVQLAVNQNGRWAPHFAYLREAIKAGLIGDIVSSHLQVHWDHTWIAGTPFEKIHNIIFYDFAIHWFDATATFWGERKAKSIYATKTRGLGQTLDSPMLAQCLIEYEGGQASLVFDAMLPFGAQDHSYIGGTKGSLVSTGPDLNQQTVTLYNEAGQSSPKLETQWFNDGFAGTMGEILSAIEDGREPQNSAKNNLKSLALCFAAIQSSVEQTPKIPGQVRRLEM